MKPQELLREAALAREKAYAPYSGFAVGAALLTKSGKVFHGCNIENAAYGPTNCAERTAIFKAISEGEREFAAIAIIADTLEPCPPCGVCRQVMVEFFDESVAIYLGNLRGEWRKATIGELLPGSFGQGILKEQMDT